MSHGKFKYESRLASEDVAGYLESLAAGIRQGEMHLESGNDSVSLRVAPDVSFECSAKENAEKGRAGFTVSVEWRSTQGKGVRPSPGLHVVSGSMLDEEATFAEDFVDRTSLGPAPAAESVRDADAVLPLEIAAGPGKKQVPRRSAPKERVTTTRSTRAKTPARKSASAKTSPRQTRTTAAGRSHARRRVAS